MFYATMPTDNTTARTAGAEIAFPQDGPTTTSTVIQRNTNNTYDFYLRVSGVYRVSYQVPVDQAGQLILSIQGQELPATLSGRDTGTSLIGLTTLIHVNANNQLTVRAALSNTSPITVSAGVNGKPTVATLVIELVKAD